LVISCLLESQSGALLKVRVVPGAKKSEITGEENGQLRVRLNSPPVEGKANKELVKLLAVRLGLKKSQVRLSKGERSRDKIVLLAGVPVSDAVMKLQKVLRGE
jgi:uncharacterized protein (TIGR00251 family)